MATPEMNAKAILNRVKAARTQLEGFLKDRTWIEDAKKMAEKQGLEVKGIIDADIAKLRVFLEKERKELEKLQAQIPGEVNRIKKFVEGRKKELSKLLTGVKANAGKKASKAKRVVRKKATAATKKASSTVKVVGKKVAGPKKARRAPAAETTA